MTVIQMMMMVVIMVVLLMTGMIVIVMRMFPLKVAPITEVVLMSGGESRNHLGEQCENSVHGSGRQ